jgi:hypothetical protein
MTKELDDKNAISQVLRHVANVQPAEPKMAERLLRAESLFGASLTAVIGGALSGVQGGSNFVNLWLNNLMADQMDKRGRQQIAHSTAMMLARADSMNKVVDQMIANGLLDAREIAPELRFTVLRQKLEEIMDAQIALAGKRRDLAKAEVPALNEEAKLITARARSQVSKALAYPTASVTEGLVAAEQITTQVVVSTAHIVAEGGKETLTTAGELIARFLGVVTAAPHAAIGYAATAMPDIAIPTALTTSVGITLGMLYAVSKGCKGEPCSAFDWEFWKWAITFGAIGFAAGAGLTIIVSRTMRR